MLSVEKNVSMRVSKRSLLETCLTYLLFSREY